MEDMYGIEINENDFIHIDRKKNPKVGRVIEDDDNKLKCVGLYLNEDGNVIIGDKFIAVLKKYDSEKLEVISREKAISILREE